MKRITVRFASEEDLEFTGQDAYIPKAVVLRKIIQKEVVIAEIDGCAAGYLRLEFLWSLVPYIGLIRVSPFLRNQGVGKALLNFIRDHLFQEGNDWLYSSSQADEVEPQAWHRHMGFVECGIIEGINDGGVSEVFFRILTSPSGD